MIEPDDYEPRDLPGSPLPEGATRWRYGSVTRSYGGEIEESPRITFYNDEGETLLVWE